MSRIFIFSINWSSILSMRLNNETNHKMKISNLPSIFFININLLFCFCFYFLFLCLYIGWYYGSNINYNLTGSLIQMELLKQLSAPQQDEFNRIRVIQNGIDDKTLEQSLRYYLEYKKNTTGHISHQKLPIVLKSALFMAEKSTSCNTVNGQRIAEPSLTLGHLLKTHPLDEVMITLKDFTKNVNMSDKEASVELSNLIKEISFLITFHKKFEKSVEKFELKERHPESNEYVKYWSYFAWLLFIQVRSKVLMKSLDLIENTCMLAQTLAFMLSFSWDHVIPTGILKIQKRINEQSQLKQVIFPIRERVLEMFSIKTLDIYTSLANTFESFFQNDLVKRNILKTNPSFDFLSPELLMTNYRRLDKYYEKNMNGIDLDERIFLKERTANMTPSKFTPFARQGFRSKTNHNDPLKQNFSHRILNYELSEKQQTTIKIGGDGGIIGRLPKAVVASPSMMRVPLIQATPITLGMQMINYVNEKKNKFKDTLSQGCNNKRPHEALASKYVDLIHDKSRKGEVDKKSKQQTVYSFFKYALEQYISKYPSEKDNQKCYRTIMAISIELYLFANNSTLMFEDIQREMELQPFELWKGFNFFLQFDKTMPLSLKLHILDLQAAVATYKMWTHFQLVEMLHQYSNNEKTNNPINAENFETFFKHFMVHIGTQIQRISSNLGLDENVQETIYDMMKHVIVEQTDLFFNMHLDQLIMCAVYAINRKNKCDKKFQEIMDVYKDLNSYNKEMHEAMIKQIIVEDKEPLNLITWYNEYYIKRLKDYVVNLKPTENGHQQNKKNYANNPALMSPLKDILPKDMNKRNASKIAHKFDGNSHKDLLVAFTDSPLLRHQPISFKTKQLKVPTGMINFDYENQQIIKINHQERRQYEKHSPRNVTNYTTEASKKPSINNMSNALWKQPQPMSGNGGLTPNRSKNITPQSTIPLNQFSSNSSQSSNIPQQSRISANNPNQNKNPYSQYGMTNLAKGLRKY